MKYLDWMNRKSEIDIQQVIDTKNQLCVCCMEEHEVQTVIVLETNIYKGIKLNYLAKYYYCSNADEYFSDEDMMNENYESMKKAYEQAINTLC